MSCRSANHQGPAPAARKLPRASLGCPNSRTPQAVSVPPAPPPTDSSLCSCSCLHVLCCGSLEPCSLGMEGSTLLPAGTCGRGFQGRGPFFQRRSRDLGLLLFFFHFGYTLGAKWGGKVRAPGGAMIWHWILSNKFAVVCTWCCL